MAHTEQPNGLPQVRRFITTHRADGQAVFSDAVPEEPPFQKFPSGAEFALCYATDQFPANTEAEADLNTYQRYLQSPPGLTIPNGSLLRVVDMPPGAASPMHRTDSLDFGIVLEGAIELSLDSGERRLMRSGDIAVQRGTSHAWRNTSSTVWTRMLFVMLPAAPLAVEEHQPGAGASH